MPKIQAEARGRLCRGSSVRTFFYRAKSLQLLGLGVFFLSSSVLLWCAYLLTVRDLRLRRNCIPPSISQAVAVVRQNLGEGGEEKKKQFPLRQQKGQQEGHRTDEKTANSFTDFLI